MFNYKYLSLIAICAATLSGCAQLPQEIPKLSPQLRSKYLNQLQTWQATGKVGVSDQHQGHNVSLEWQQDQTKYNIHFWGPFASGSARIIGKPGQVTLTTSEGQKFTGTEPESLMFENLGWDLPFNGLTYWIKGMSSPYSAPTLKKFDQYNQLQTLQQDGWLIDYQSYTVYGKITLPEKINLTNGKLKIKLIIKEWQS